MSEIYEHRIRAYLSAAEAMKNASDPITAEKIHTAVILEAQRNEKACGWKPEVK
jgi:hypothetical protein